MTASDISADPYPIRAGNDDLPALYDELKAVAHHLRNRLHPGDTLSTTVVVHEAYARLAAGDRFEGNDREHLLATCARAMRFVLIDHLRERGAAKRGASLPELTLDNSLLAHPDDPLSLLALHQSLEQLQARDPRLVNLIELRVFAGLEPTAIAEVLQVTVRTVQRDWRRANAWLTADLP